ncbi:MAG: helicase, partial [Rubrivivax sp.]|nr:helicase [Rubrivivax sp.]
MPEQAPIPPAAAAATPNLPDPRHIGRLPPHIGKAQVARIRHAAYLLPQVVKPADFIADSSPDLEQHLDKLGLVLLQKPVSGARPSRWIAPDAMDAALAHLDAVGSGPEVRALMLERTGALESMGVARHAGAWTRLISHSQRLVESGWSVPVLFRVPVAPAAIWDFYRSGDRAALLAALGAPPLYSHAAALVAHLDALVARSRAHKPEQLGSLLPRLQSECALPNSAADFGELSAACSRAQERWRHHADELDTLEGLTSELAFQGYPGTFPAARRLQRRVTLYVGPPNSGKTYAAFERLAQALDGAYLAPLRLLALEGRDRLVGRGVPCSLLTGEENVPAADARVVSSTIEMVSTSRAIDVAVIDEAQMIFDNSRGWAWTQAIVAVPAREVIIICSAYAVPAIEKLLGLCGEACQQRHFERMQHVELLAQPVAIAQLELGD